ncbi:MAG: hypothetical protein F6K63_20905 [Moorea sp. SIO1G6]|uniref:hypothetical protein n=1 Tax=Moorena sp. SIO1G6 TaxID=2607840 RepID=UPI0013BFB1CB|nr:hypothetical protein [Moorena sp. SIO1G6]NET66713.1 hypothetical protein [Moorena sp. SIO1G6]
MLLVTIALGSKIFFQRKYEQWWKGLSRQEKWSYIKKGKLPSLIEFVKSDLGKLPEPEQILEDAEYESIFLSLLEGVSTGWQKAEIEDFFAKQPVSIDQSTFQSWLRKFCRRLMKAPQGNIEVAQRMISFGEIGDWQLGRISKEFGEKILTASRRDTVVVYVNPFTLLGLDPEKYNTVEDISATNTIRSKKKRFLAKLKINDNQFELKEGFKIKQAEAYLEDLRDEQNKKFHFIIFKDKKLHDFITFGDFQFFEQYVPKPDYQDEEFRGFIGKYFARQYGNKLDEAIRFKDLGSIKSLFSIELLVLPEHYQICFGRSYEFLESCCNALKEIADFGIDAKHFDEKELLAKIQEVLDIELVNSINHPFFLIAKDRISQCLIKIGVELFHLPTYEHIEYEFLVDSSLKVIDLASQLKVSENTSKRVKEIKDKIIEDKGKSKDRKLNLNLYLNASHPLEITDDYIRYGITVWVLESIEAIKLVPFGYNSQLRTCSFLNNQGQQISFTPMMDDLNYEDELRKELDLSLRTIMANLKAKIRIKIYTGTVVEIGNCCLSSQKISSKDSTFSCSYNDFKLISSDDYPNLVLVTTNKKYINIFLENKENFENYIKYDNKFRDKELSIEQYKKRIDPYILSRIKSGVISLRDRGALIDTEKEWNGVLIRDVLRFQELMITGKMSR